MPVPNIDTFEQDVSDELKKKEASFTDIASAGGTVENAPPSPKGRSMLFPALVGILFFIGAAGAGGYYYYLTRKASAPAQPLQTQPPSSAVSIRDISVTLEQAIGPSIESIESSEHGYILRLNEFTPVFAYLIRNEGSYAEDLAASVGSPRDASTSSLPFSFEDVTASNQNMRVGTSGSSTVAYAFVNTTHLLISSSTEGILALRGAILKQ